MATVIDTPEGIAFFAFMQVLTGLRMEVTTGLKLSSRGSILKVAQQRYGVTSRTKKGALAEMIVLYEEITGKPYTL